jgi:hypothetical protein
MSILDLFRRKSFERFANGAYGSVYGNIDSPWIVKQAQNDGTRSFLEWCMLKCRRGERMKGMPEIDFLIEEPDYYSRGSYIVAMKRYQPILNRMGEFFGAEAVLNLALPNAAIHRWPTCPTYIPDLIKAFETDMQRVVNCCDVHSSNIMYDADLEELIVTDPSSGPYYSLGTQPAVNPAQFELALQ